MRFSPRVRRCSAHLALRETAADRPELAAALWPDAAARDALGNLRRRLHDLSGALHAVGLADAVEVTRDRVALSAHARWAIDVVRYSILARDPSQAARAAALYREPIFPGLDDEVLEQARRRLHGAQIELLTRLLDAAIGRRDAPADRRTCRSDRTPRSLERTYGRQSGGGARSTGRERSRAPPLRAALGASA